MIIQLKFIFLFITTSLLSKVLIQSSNVTTNVFTNETTSISISSTDSVQTTFSSDTTTPYIIKDVFADFTMSCDNVTCTYSIQSPALSEAWINELKTAKNMTNMDQIVYNDDNSILKNYKNQTDQLCNLNNYTNTYNELYEQFSKLQANIIQFNKSYKNLIDNYMNLTNNFNKFPTYDCYYYCKDFKPTTTTVLSTLQPTISPDPCSKQSCDAEINGKNYNGKCVASQFSSYCECPGNLDPYNSCQNVGCYSTLNGKPDMLLNGPIWSPGYLGQLTTSTTYPKGITCNWQIRDINEVENLTLSVNTFNLADGSSLTISTDILSVSFTNAYDIDSIRETIVDIIQNASFIKLKFKSGTKVSSNVHNYFDLYLNGTNPITPTTFSTSTQSPSITTTEDECNGQWVTVDYLSKNEYFDDKDNIITSDNNSQTTLEMTTLYQQFKSTLSPDTTTSKKKNTKRICVTKQVTSSMSTTDDLTTSISHSNPI